MACFFSQTFRCFSLLCVHFCLTPRHHPNTFPCLCCRLSCYTPSLMSRALSNESTIRLTLTAPPPPRSALGHSHLLKNQPLALLVIFAFEEEQAFAKSPAVLATWSLREVAMSVPPGEAFPARSPTVLFALAFCWLAFLPAGSLASLFASGTVGVYCGCFSALRSLENEPGREAERPSRGSRRGTRNQAVRGCRVDLRRLVDL